MEIDTGRETAAARVIFFALLGAAFVLAVVKLSDYDAWTHLALGREIVERQALPAKEPFNFPSVEMPYYNPEWLFDVLLYLAYLGSGTFGVIFSKAMLAALACAILFKDSLLPSSSQPRSVFCPVVAALFLLPMLVLIRHRFVERPDLVLMVFLTFTVYALNAYLYEGKRYLYALPVMQIVWVNMHPSIVVGVVPFVAFLVGGSLQGVLNRRFGLQLPGTPSSRQLRTVAAVLGAVLAASFLNPYGMEPFLAPFKLASAIWFRHEIVELQPPAPGDLYGAPYIIGGLLALAFLLNLRRLSVISLLLVLPFLYLGFSAARFVFLLALIAAPLLARQTAQFAASLRLEGRAPLGFAHAVGVAALVGVTASAVVAQKAPFADPYRIPGWGIHYDPLPEGALSYLDRIDLRGRVYNSFKWGGYILWRDYPRRIPIIDGRGYVPPGLLDEIQRAKINAEILKRLQQEYRFEVAIVEYPLGTEIFGHSLPEMDLALTSEDWALVYWDDLALVYLKRTESLAAIIERDEYRHIRPANGVLDLRRKVAEAARRAPIEAEIRRNINETRSSTGYMLLGEFYNDTGDYERAIVALEKVRHFPFHSHRDDAYLGLAFAYEKTGRLERAIDYYKEVARRRDAPVVYYALGAALEKSGDDQQVVDYLERALSGDSDLAAAYPPLIRAYRRLGDIDRVAVLERAYRKVFTRHVAAQRVSRGVKLYLEGKLRQAMIEFKEGLKLDPHNAVALSNLGYIYYDLGGHGRALAYQKQAVEADPGYANAYYGLALIFRDWGEKEKAEKYFNEYLRLEPRGYWARKAREEIERARAPQS